MIVYQCNSIGKPKQLRRYVKMRVSDKNKRFYDNFHKRRGQSYWWKNVDEKDTNTVQEHM
jgi:hypothetical protein